MANQKATQNGKQDLNVNALRLAVLTSEMTFAQAAARLGRSEWRACVRMKQLRQQVGQVLFPQAGQTACSYRRRQSAHRLRPADSGA